VSIAGVLFFRVTNVTCSPKVGPPEMGVPR
jgi:hypothetical protein